MQRILTRMCETGAYFSAPGGESYRTVAVTDDPTSEAFDYHIGPGHERCAVLGPVAEVRVRCAAQGHGSWA